MSGNDQDDLLTGIFTDFATENPQQVVQAKSWLSEILSKIFSAIGLGGVKSGGLIESLFGRFMNRGKSEETSETEEAVVTEQLDPALTGAEAAVAGAPVATAQEVDQIVDQALALQFQHMVTSGVIPPNSPILQQGAGALTAPMENPYGPSPTEAGPEFESSANTLGLAAAAQAAADAGVTAPTAEADEAPADTGAAPLTSPSN